MYDQEVTVESVSIDAKEQEDAVSRQVSQHFKVKVTVLMHFFYCEISAHIGPLDSVSPAPPPFTAIGRRNQEGFPWHVVQGSMSGGGHMTPPALLNLNKQVCKDGRLQF